MALLPGCSNQSVSAQFPILMVRRTLTMLSYGYEPQFSPENYLSFFERIPPLYSRDGVRMDVQANTSHTDKGFYSSDTYSDNLIQYISEWKDESSPHHSKPFFAYLPFSAPHWPLQCSPEDRDVYKGVYDEGPDVLRKKRLERLVEMGIHKPGVEAAAVIAPELSEWDEMTAEERKLSVRAMETYAGMVTA
jgi:arylsulfatase A-like enzyme